MNSAEIDLSDTEFWRLPLDAIVRIKHDHPPRPPQPQRVRRSAAGLLHKAHCPSLRVPPRMPMKVALRPIEP
jgi:hypothetical protein